MNDMFCNKIWPLALTSTRKQQNSAKNTLKVSTRDQSMWEKKPRVDKNQPIWLSILKDPRSEQTSCPWAHLTTDITFFVDRQKEIWWSSRIKILSIAWAEIRRVSHFALRCASRSGNSLTTLPNHWEWKWFEIWNFDCENDCHRPVT